MYGKINIVQFSCSVILTHLQSAFPMESSRYFGIGLWGCSNFGQKDTFLIIVCPYWKLPLEAWALKWSCQNTLKALFLNHIYFPLGTPLYHGFWCFPTSSSCSSQSSHIFCQPPCWLHGCSWWNLSAHRFFCCLLVMTLSMASPPLSSPPSNIFEKGQAFPLCCHKTHCIGVFSSQIHPVFISPVFITPLLTEPNISFHCKQQNLSFSF